MRKVEPERIQAVIKANPAIGVKELAERFGVHANTIRLITKRLELKLPTTAYLTKKECEHIPKKDNHCWGWKEMSKRRLKKKRLVCSNQNME